MATTTTTTRRRLPEKKGFEAACLHFVRNYAGKNYLKALAKFISRETGVAYVIVGYPDSPQLNHAKSAVMLAKGKFVIDYGYDLQGTPCENVMGRNCCYYPSNIQQMFPLDLELRHFGIQSYIGMPVYGIGQKPIGMLVLMDSKTIGNPSEIEKGLIVLIPRTARELEIFLLDKARTETEAEAAE
jgi:hypothetical protein